MCTGRFVIAQTSGSKQVAAWRQRALALRNVPPALRIVWQSGRSVVVLGLITRVAASFLPIALLWVTKLIVDSINHPAAPQHALSKRLWELIALEFAIAVAISVLSRVIDFLDSLLAEKYMRYVSLLVMKHAATLDLQAYEDPVFYDRLERARVQATDRLGMIQAIGRLVQQTITAILMSVSIAAFSPWFLLLLCAGVLPAFLGESHFAFLGYAKNFRQTPIRRQLDYLRQLAGSKEAAKELKLFGLSSFLTKRFTALSNRVYDEDVALARRRLAMGSVLSVLGTIGYYAAYAFVIWKTLLGALTIGSLTFLAGAIQQASLNIQQVFSTLAGIADQALFLTDLLAFFAMQPTIRSLPNAVTAPPPSVEGFDSRKVCFRYPGPERWLP